MVGTACAPIDQDMTVMSWGAAVACQVGAGVFVGTVVVAVGVGAWISSLCVRDWGVSLSASGSTCAGVAHNSDAGVSVSMTECSPHSV